MGRESIAFSRKKSLQREFRKWANGTNLKNNLRNSPIRDIRVKVFEKKHYSKIYMSTFLEKTIVGKQLAFSF
jgi:hypothetical protein